jgi:hypothetical protein
MPVFQQFTQLDNNMIFLYRKVLPQNSYIRWVQDGINENIPPILTRY